MFGHYEVTSPVERVELNLDDRVKLGGDRHFWRVQAVTENFVAVTRKVRKGVIYYTVLDWRSGVRGPCNLIGQGWGDGTYTKAECAEMLAEFEADELEISHRNNVALEILEIVPRKEGAPLHE